MKWPVVALSISLATPIIQARADCVSDCVAATYCDSDMHASGECGQKLNACYIAQCSKPRTTYGAIAYDAESGAVGWSYDFSDGPAAERRALMNCREHGDGCKVVVDFWNSCAAVAADTDRRFEIGQGDSQDQAQAAAMNACQAEGEDCSIQAWSCTKP